jgi:hypothetical protein
MDFRLRRGNQLRRVKVNLISLNTLKLSFHLVQGVVPLPSARQANVIDLIAELERLLRPQNLFRKN